MKCPSKQYPECWSGCPEIPVCFDAKDTIASTTQKLFNDAGYAGNVYKADPKLLQRFENQAIEILKGE